MADFKGRPILIVNVASKCGFTSQYKHLQALYTSFSDQGLVVLGVPSNDFMGQEPGSNRDIALFCSGEYGVTFPMLEKTSVKGPLLHPLYHYLTTQEANTKWNGKIKWNFTKFLIDPSGTIINRFSSSTSPQDEPIQQAIRATLSSPHRD